MKVHPSDISPNNVSWLWGGKWSWWLVSEDSDSPLLKMNSHVYLDGINTTFDCIKSQFLKMAKVWGGLALHAI